MSRTVETAVTRFLASRARFSPLEIAFWLAAFAAIWLLPGRHLILTETAIWGLFAVSLDLILGYAGIISLGHAAFFGVGAYAAGLLAKHEIIVEPTMALICAGLIAAVLGFATSFLVLRGSDLTRLMVTLGVSLVCYELANKFGEITGGADGLQGVTMAPVFGVWRFDLFGHTAYIYTLAWLFVLFMLARRIVNSPFGLSLKAIKGNALRSSAIGIAVNWRLVAVYTLSAGYAGIAGGLLAQTQAFASLSMLSIDRSADVLLILIIGGTGYLYGGLIGALIYRFLQDYLSDLTARYWQFWIGLLLVAIVIVGRERIGAWSSSIAMLIRQGSRRPRPLNEAPQRGEAKTHEKERPHPKDIEQGEMTISKALEILGLKSGATEQEIRAAYNKLMQRVHPDVGGSNFVAQQLNVARDLLLSLGSR